MLHNDQKCQPTRSPADAFYVVTSTKGHIDFTKDLVDIQYLHQYGFSVQREEASNTHWLVRGCNRVAPMFTHRAALDEYLQGLAPRGDGFRKELLAWWFV
ncbi:hypothetical protein [Pseudomonas mosselii]|uniref:hypothetical protein n=1 Tax=Pseudomonas mosselii TaxID=78327 RepID=UPI0021D9C55D|nr:hypothetical protein [Pseudomonas mosselii]MCU9528057.1 hypothetical protein [Pseudomonas mosselii]MCU9535166.1 hypothetical protein [Pseudomonas mosselii]MCU9542685.1 hypothetical protein [Pseudomonas mosselii]MCU9546901.1 hypothetical protein [Pseudomonas mosselii]